MSKSWIAHKFGGQLARRGITTEEHFLKMERLVALGHVRVWTTDGIWYEVEGKRRMYNPIKNIWRSSKGGEK